MGRYFARRLVQAIPLLLGISIISFFAMRMMPGGPMAGYLMNPRVTPADVARLEEAWGLDQPLMTQYIKWLSSMLAGDWGWSYRTGLPVLEMIMQRLPQTLQLMVTSYVLAAIVAIPLGIFSAVYRYSIFDYCATVFAFMGVAIPSFWFAVMMQLVFSVRLGWLPSAGMATIGLEYSLVDRLSHMIMPVFVLALINMASWSRYMRSSMLEVVGQDYVRTAMAKGLSHRAVIYKHALKNALIPVATIMGLDLPVFFGGAALTETIFAWPGMGQLFVDSVFSRDYPILMGVLMLTAVLVVLGNLLADLTYGLLDPRIHYD
ncbi:MAG: ABC transporter permease [Firmicutes bacterium]|nr:ABC transporter permease [Bacillota bacterium]